VIQPKCDCGDGCAAYNEWQIMQEGAEIMKQALERVGQVLFDHPHADTCATELSPGEGYDCSCWRAALWAAVGE
jgi:hypothetical protein